ncbi:hypothetical protein EV646_108275 [Kribbella antiqua]|uniref:Big-1 domain-containing protein n=1 Tax=Kribbella antiqua TaxID=2512217 RepID=A0A4R2IMB2_9ACTN|nr:hypothetical protein [Kribbella antiqua]TCO45652.1 hypothetical protein EV646_108275 [Kribbella antiqua]
MSTLRSKRAWLIALVALLIGVGILEGPAAFAASGVTGVTFSGSNQAGGAPANWTVGFTTTNGASGQLSAGDKITVTFNTGFTVPAGPAITLGSGFTSCTATATTASTTVTITLAGAGCVHTKATAAVLTIAGITNAPVGTYGASTFTIATTGDTNAVSPGSSVVLTAARLVYTTQPPSTGTAGSPLATFRVAIQDGNSNTVTGWNDTISLSIASGPSGGTFSSAPSTYTNVATSAGVAAFTGVAFGAAGTYTLTAADTTAGHTGFATATSTAIVISAGGASKLAFVQGPSNGFAGTALTPAITVQVQDQNGNAVAASGIGVTLTPSAGVINSGATATTNSAGRATFSSVVIETAAVGLTLTASATGLTSTGASSAFNVTVAVSTGATLTNTATDGTGSGVKTVAYYYCAGYSGACTSSNWTAIGSSTASATNYSVTWNSQPANGAYRLVAAGTDNITNTSQPSASIPITIAN